MNITDLYPPAKDAEPLSPAQSDQKLEQQLFLLMGQIEQQIMQLAPVTDGVSYASNVEIAKEILVQILEFTDENLNSRDFGPLYERAGAFHDATRQFERLLGTSSWNGLASFFGLRTVVGEGAEVAYKKWSADFTQLVQDFCLGFIRQFQSAEKIEEWIASTSVLLDDLKHHW